MSSNPQNMTLTLTYILRSCYKAIVRNDVSETRYWFEVICLLVKDDKELMTLEAVRRVSNQAVTLLIQTYSQA